jgi:hypothetical protein
LPQNRVRLSRLTKKNQWLAIVANVKKPRPLTGFPEKGEERINDSTKALNRLKPVDQKFDLPPHNMYNI